MSNEKLTDDEIVTLQTVTKNLKIAIADLGYCLKDFTDVIDDICK